jgi:hypothetical protein
MQFFRKDKSNTTSKDLNISAGKLEQNLNFFKRRIY